MPLMDELSYLARELTYARERRFEFRNSGSVVVHQDISHTSGTVWDASIVLAHYLDRMISQSEFKDKYVLELGAGTALPSLIAFKKGAKVTSTDLEIGLAAGQQTCRDNDHLEPSAEATPTWLFQTLTWGSSIDQKVDFIFGADLFYEERHFSALQHTIDSAVVSQCECLAGFSRPGTRVILSFEQRRKDVNALFFSWFRTHGSYTITNMMMEVGLAPLHVVQLVKRCSHCHDLP